MVAREKQTIRTQEIVLEDAQGKEVAALRQGTEGGAVLEFMGTDGKPRLSVGVEANGTARISLTYANGQGAIELEANSALNSAGLVVVGSQGRVQVLLGVTADGLPAFALLDAAGIPQVSNLQPKEKGNLRKDDGSFDWNNLLRG